MSQSHVVSNLPPILFSTNIQETVLAANGDSSISLISSDEEDQAINCFDNGDAQPTISIINSSDVVIGSVTQFHGPVTIVQHIPAIDDRKCIGTEEKNKAKLVLDESIELTKSHQHTCLPKRLLVCFATVTITLFIIILTLVLALDTTAEPPLEDHINPYNLTGHTYYTLTEWGGRTPLWAAAMEPPVRWVIISHTVGEQCRTLASCSSQMRLMQDMHVADGSPNIGYNFVIGADGNVYEGRGWFTQNFHVFEPNSVAISFTGNYVYDELSDEMVDVLEKLLALAVDMKVISPSFKLIAHNQTLVTLSPGPNIYRVIKNFPNFYQDQRPRTNDNDN